MYGNSIATYNSLHPTFHPIFGRLLGFNPNAIAALPGRPNTRSAGTTLKEFQVEVIEIPCLVGCALRGWLREFELNRTRSVREVKAKQIGIVRNATGALGVIDQVRWIVL